MRAVVSLLSTVIRLSTLSTLQKVRNLDSAKLYNVFVFDVRIASAKLRYASPVNGISLVRDEEEEVVVVAEVVLVVDLCISVVVVQKINPASSINI
jgi:hypothetical protein